MADQFIIVKLYHVTDRMQPTDAYAGPSCDQAQVDPGKVYASRAEAKLDAQALSRYNYGFAIVECYAPYPENIRDVYVDGKKQDPSITIR